MKKYIVSISGCDNCGKSTQLKLLHSKYPNIFSPPLHLIDFPAYPRIVDRLAFSKWWFTPSNAHDMVSIIINCIKQRHELAMSEEFNYPIVLFDRDDQSYINKTMSALLTMGYGFMFSKQMIESVKEEFNLDNAKLEDIKIYITGTSQINAIKQEENKYSYNPTLYAKHMKITNILDNITLRNDRSYTLVNYIEKDIEGVNANILSEIRNKIKQNSHIKNNSENAHE